MTKSKKKTPISDKDILIQEDIRRLVVERIKVSSDNLRIAVGSEGPKSVGEMIESVKQGDDEGKQIIEAHIDFLKAMATGKIYSDE